MHVTKVYTQPKIIYSCIYELMDADQKYLARDYAPQQLSLISQDIGPLELTYEINRVLDYRMRDNEP